MSAPQTRKRVEPTFAELFTPKLVTLLREGYGWTDFRADAIAGLTVAIVRAQHLIRVLRFDPDHRPQRVSALGGGTEQGTSTLIIGPAGTGKSLLTLQFIDAALQRGENAAMF